MTPKQKHVDDHALPPLSGTRSAQVPDEEPAPAATKRALWTAEEIYRATLPLVLAMARNKGFDENGQQEIAQQVGVVILEKIGKYAPERGTPRMWVAGIAR